MHLLPIGRNRPVFKAGGNKRDLLFMQSKFNKIIVHLMLETR
jgi:hypothetical protein